MKEEKNAYRKIWWKNKEKGYLWILWGVIVACLGLIGVIIVYVLDQKMEIFEYPIQLVFYGLMLVLTLIGGGLDLIGEVQFNKAFHNHINKKDKK